MRVVWMPTAKTAVRDIAKYIRKEFGKKVRDEFLQEVRQSSKLIGKNPNAGIVEPLLADRPIMYRSYVVNRLNKIVYSIIDDHIEVHDFWDVRREPSSLADEVK